MTQQITIEVDNATLLRSLKKILASIQGVSIIKRQSTTRRHHTAYDEAQDDIHHGRVNTYTSATALFDKFHL